MSRNSMSCPNDCDQCDFKKRSTAKEWCFMYNEEPDHFCSQWRAKSAPYLGVEAKKVHEV